MNYRFCHRCQAELPPHDEGTLIFCTHCGAPQVLLSEELQSQIETQSRTAEDTPVANHALRDPSSLLWAGAIRCAAMAGGVAAVLAGLSILLPAASLLAWLWAVISPVVVIGLFQARFPLALISTSFGARLGLLTGLAISTALGIVTTVIALVARFGTHSMSTFDSDWAQAFEQAQTRVVAQSGPQVLPMMKALLQPDFRAGIMLVFAASGIAVLLAVTTAGGAFAGFVRSRSRS